MYADNVRYRALRWLAMAPEEHPLMGDIPHPQLKGDAVLTAAVFDEAIDDVIDYLAAHGVSF